MCNHDIYFHTSYYQMSPKACIVASTKRNILIARLSPWIYKSKGVGAKTDDATGIFRNCN